MTAMTTRHRHQHTCTPAYGTEGILARQLSWTRMGNAMGYTNTEAKRAEIRGAVEAMVWRDPAELAGVLDVAPARQMTIALLGGRRWALQRAAVTALPAADPLRPVRRVLAIEAVSGERYVLLDDCGYEWVHLYTDRPVHEQVVSAP